LYQIRCLPRYVIFATVIACCARQCRRLLFEQDLFNYSRCALHDSIYTIHRRLAQDIQLLQRIRAMLSALKNIHLERPLWPAGTTCQALNSRQQGLLSCWSPCLEHPAGRDDISTITDDFLSTSENLSFQTVLS